MSTKAVGLGGLSLVLCLGCWLSKDWCKDDCRKSGGCQKEGLMCYALSDRDCQQSEICRESGACKAQDKMCVVGGVKPVAASDPLNEADDTTLALATFYPIVCQAAKARKDVDACKAPSQGRTTYDKITACVDEALASMRRLDGALPPDKAKTECGKTVEGNVRKDVKGTINYLEETREWLTANGKAIKRTLAASGTLRDGVDGAPGAPWEGTTWDKKNDPDGMKTFDRGTFNMKFYECTKRVYQCGHMSDNVCWVNKVTDRLGLACDPSTNKVSSSPNDVLHERATGRVLPPVRR